jgi:hypothetical protein
MTNNNINHKTGTGKAAYAGDSSPPQANPFVSDVSHELRTPLTSIRGALGLLRGGLLDPKSDQGKRLLEIAINNTDRLVRFTNALEATTHVLEQAATTQDAISKILQALCESLGWQVSQFWGIEEIGEQGGATRLYCLDTWQIDSISSAEFQVTSKQMTLAPGIGPTGSRLG